MKRAERFVGVVGILCALSVALLMVRIDPVQASRGVRGLFFASLFCAVWGVSTYLFSFIRPRVFSHAFRRGLLLAVLVILILSARIYLQIGYIGIGVLVAGCVGLEALISYAIRHATHFHDFS